MKKLILLLMLSLIVPQESFAGTGTAVVKNKAKNIYLRFNPQAGDAKTRWIWPDRTKNFKLSNKGFDVTGKWRADLPGAPDIKPRVEMYAPNRKIKSTSEIKPEDFIGFAGCPGKIKIVPNKKTYVTYTGNADEGIVMSASEPGRPNTIIVEPLVKKNPLSYDKEHTTHRLINRTDKIVNVWVTFAHIKTMGIIAMEELATYLTFGGLGAAIQAARAEAAKTGTKTVLKASLKAPGQWLMKKSAVIKGFVSKGAIIARREIARAQRAINKYIAKKQAIKGQKTILVKSLGFKTIQQLDDDIVKKAGNFRGLATKNVNNKFGKESFEILSKKTQEKLILEEAQALALKQVSKRAMKANQVAILKQAFDNAPLAQREVYATIFNSTYDDMIKSLNRGSIDDILSTMSKGLPEGKVIDDVFDDFITMAIKNSPDIGPAIKTLQRELTQLQLAIVPKTLSRKIAFQITVKRIAANIDNTIRPILIKIKDLPKTTKQRFETITNRYRKYAADRAFNKEAKRLSSISLYDDIAIAAKTAPEGTTRAINVIDNITDDFIKTGDQFTKQLDKSVKKLDDLTLERSALKDKITINQEVLISEKTTVKEKASLFDKIIADKNRLGKIKPQIKTLTNDISNLVPTSIPTKTGLFAPARKFVGRATGVAGDTIASSLRYTKEKLTTLANKMKLPEAYKSASSKIKSVANTTKTKINDGYNALSKRLTALKESFGKIYVKTVINSDEFFETAIKGLQDLKASFGKTYVTGDALELAITKLTKFNTRLVNVLKAPGVSTSAAIAGDIAWKQILANKVQAAQARKMMQMEMDQADMDYAAIAQRLIDLDLDIDMLYTEIEILEAMLSAFPENTATEKDLETKYIELGRLEAEYIDYTEREAVQLFVMSILEDYLEKLDEGAAAALEEYEYEGEDESEEEIDLGITNYPMPIGKEYDIRTVMPSNALTAYSNATSGGYHATLMPGQVLWCRGGADIHNMFIGIHSGENDEGYIKYTKKFNIYNKDLSKITKKQNNKIWIPSRHKATKEWTDIYFSVNNKTGKVIIKPTEPYTK